MEKITIKILEESDIQDLFKFELENRRFFESVATHSRDFSHELGVTCINQVNQVNRKTT